MDIISIFSNPEYVKLMQMYEIPLLICGVIFFYRYQKIVKSEIKMLKEFIQQYKHNDVANARKIKVLQNKIDAMVVELRICQKRHKDRDKIECLMKEKLVSLEEKLQPFLNKKTKKTK